MIIVEFMLIHLHYNPFFEETKHLINKLRDRNLSSEPVSSRAEERIQTLWTVIYFSFLTFIARPFSFQVFFFPISISFVSLDSEIEDRPIFSQKV